MELSTHYTRTGRDLSLIHIFIGTKPHQSLIILKKTKYGAIGQSLLVVHLLEKIGILYIVSYANQWTNQCDKN